ncbi:Methionine aminopeptidase 1 [Rhodotorula kratochvilovae]
MVDDSSPAAANGSTGAAPAGTNGASAIPRTCANGCGKKAGTLECPKCRELGVPGQFFCSQLCFASKYPLHVRKKHAPKPQPSYTYPPGTHDPFKGVKNHKYTGALRAVYPDVPVPKREVPPHIVRPDHADEANGVSFSERTALINERAGRVLGPEGIEAMRKVCRLSREVLDIAAAAIRPGITTLELDAIVHDECIKRDAYPSPLNYGLFPRSVCTSINEIICHGIPDARPLEDGDIINLDVSLYHGGYHGDINATYPVGPSVPQQSLDLIACSRECLDEAIRMCKPGVAYQDLGRVIEEVATRYGFHSNKTYSGHGINELFHAPAPNVFHYAGNRASGVMKPGQTFTIEPMICVGSAKDVHWADNWTAATSDGKPSAQFEETLLITETGVEVLTAAPGRVLPEKKVAGGAEAQEEKAVEEGAKAQGEGAPKKKKKKAKKAAA